MLAEEECHQIPLHPNVKYPEGIPHTSTLKTMKVKYSDVAKKMEEILPYLKKWISEL